MKRFIANCTVVGALALSLLFAPVGWTQQMRRPLVSKPLIDNPCPDCPSPIDQGCLILCVRYNICICPDVP